MVKARESEIGSAADVRAGDADDVLPGVKSAVTSIEALLGLEPLNRGIVVAGRSGLAREVRTVTVGEVPDQALFLEGGELVLTSFFAFKDSPEGAIDHLVALYEGGAAGVAFKPERFIGDLPEGALLVADRLDFPIVSLPADVTWPSVIAPVLRRLLADRNNILEYSLQAHNELMEVVLRGGGLAQIGDQARKTSGREILIFDSTFNLLAKAATDTTAHMVAPLERLAAPLLSVFASSGLLRKTEVDWRPVEWINPEGRVPPCTLVPVVGHGEIHGYVLAVAAAEEENLNPFQRVILEQAAMVVALELLKQQAVQSAAWELEGDLLEDLLDGAPVSDADFARRAAPLGVSPALGYWVVIVEPRSSGPQIANSRVRTMRTVRAVRAALHQGVAGLVGDVGECAVSVLPDNRNASIGSIVDRLLQGVRRAEPSWEVRVGVSRRVPSVADLRPAFEEAMRALAVGRLTRPGVDVIHVDDIGVFDLIAQSASREEVMRFCDRITSSLRDQDARTGGELCRTLATYLDNHQSAKETAAALYIHRNTLAERLDKIRRYTNIDFENAVACLNWQVALRMPDILQGARQP